MDSKDQGSSVADFLKQNVAGVADAKHDPDKVQDKVSDTLRREPEVEADPTADVGPETGFRVTNIGKTKLGLFSVSHDQTGIMVHRQVATVEPGESWENHSTYDLLRVKTVD